MMYYMVLWNIFVFLLYGIDKYKSKQGGFRISEELLLFSTLTFGGAGAILGMMIFRHKIRKIKFRVVATIGVVIIFIVILKL